MTMHIIGHFIILASLFVLYVSRSNVYSDKCSMPTIAYDKGELVFSCETEGVAFKSEVTVSDAKAGDGSRISLARTYAVSVRAMKDGYADSDEATATIQWRDGRPLFEGFSSVTIEGKAANDVNGDGTVDVADIATVIDEMAAQARMLKIED